MRSRGVLLAGALIGPLVLGCATAGQGGKLSCPVALVASDEIELAGRQRYRLSIEAGGLLRRADMVTFRDPGPSGGAWVLVGFTPFNTRLFTLRQVGHETTVVDAMLAERFGIDPLQVQDALHRAAFVKAPGSAEAGERVTTWVRQGESVRDSWNGERLAARVFSASSEARDHNASRISIEYSAAPPAGASASWTIDNPSCGYRATVITLAPLGRQID